MVQAHRTSSNLHEPHHHRASKVCRVLLHKSGVVQAQRTYTKHTSTELARCVGYFFSSSGWFKHSEPLRTYTNHTITELARCVGCLCTSSGGSSTANLHEPHHHKASKVCLGCFCTSSGWFKHSEPTRTTPAPCSRCVGH